MADQLKELGEMVKPLFLALAFVGALFALSFWPPSTKTKAFINVLIGTVGAVLSVPFVMELARWSWPSLPEWSNLAQGGIYFWTGLLWMQCVPVVAFLLGRLKNLTLPGVKD